MIVCASVAVAGAVGGCSANAGSGTDSSEDQLQEDTKRDPQILHVPVRFTRNEVSDVGLGFSSSWVPLTGVKHEKLDGYSWGLSSGGKAEQISAVLKPDAIGAGYATAWFQVEIPYDTKGKLAYGLIRVKLESEFTDTLMVSTVTRKYSSLRVRAGANSDQPCLSITMSGGLDGKFKPVPLPFTDEGFTEHDWNIGDTDGTGVPIKQVAVGTFQFSASCWPENVEGKTSVSGGVGIPGVPAFVMVDKGSGQGEGGRATISINLLENEKGAVSLGATFSTNGGILNERDRQKFDAALSAFAKKFSDDAQRGEMDAANNVPIGP